MRRTDALKRTLEGLSRVYEGDKSVPVQFGSPSRAVPRGHDLPEGTATEDSVVISPNVKDELGRNLDGPQQLRCIANTLSHEIEHLRESDLTSKEAFMEQYDDHPQFAGMVINVLEDQYIDYTRTQRYPGLRKAQAFVVDTLMQNHHRWPRVDNIDHRPKAMQEAFRQLAFAGYAKGFEDADDWLREYLGRVRPLIDRVRREHDQEARKDIAHQCMAISEEYLPDHEDIEMPDECVVCEQREPVVIVPLLGPVCEECAPSGHGPDDGRREVEIPDDLDAGDGDGVPVPAPDQPDDADAEPGEGDGEGGDGEGAGGEGEGADEGGDGEPGDAGDGGDGRGEQAPVSDAGDDRGIDPTEWDWLDLDGHEGHTVSIVDDDAEV